MVQNRLSNIGDDVGSTVGQWTMSAAIGHLRNYVAGVIENGENDMELFNQFVVRPGESADRRVARQRRIESRRNGTCLICFTLRKSRLNYINMKLYYLLNSLNVSFGYR